MADGSVALMYGDGWSHQPRWMLEASEDSPPRRSRPKIYRPDVRAGCQRRVVTSAMAWLGKSK